MPVKIIASFNYNGGVAKTTNNSASEQNLPWTADVLAWSI